MADFVYLLICFFACMAIFIVFFGDDIVRFIRGIADIIRGK